MSICFFSYYSFMLHVLQYYLIEQYYATKFLTGIFLLCVDQSNSVFFVLNVFTALFIYSSTIYWPVYYGPDVQRCVRIAGNSRWNFFLSSKILVPSLCNDIIHEYSALLLNWGWILSRLWRRKKSLLCQKRENLLLKS